MKYCTYITFYRGNKLPPFYIGSSSVEKINKGYHGSVSSKKYRDIWKSELKNNPHLFKTKIVTLHEDRKCATNREYKFQKQFNVSNNCMYINEAYADKNFIYGKKRGPSPLKGRKLGKRSENDVQAIRAGISKNKDKPKSEKYKKSRIEAAKKLTGRTKKPHSAETKLKISSAKLGQPSPMKGKKQLDINPNYVNNKSMLGKKHSIESRLKMVTARKDMKMSESHLRNLRIAVSGKNSKKALKINIYNSSHEMVFACHGNFDKTCSENGLPNGPLKFSYRNEGIPIYTKTGKCIKYSNRIPGWEVFIGWYAVKIDRQS